jgi:hypothetical protein
MLLMYGNDKVYAGYGDDLIYARDTEGVDNIDCGAGFDKVETIQRDDVTLSNCERTRRSRRSLRGAGSRKGGWTATHLGKGWRQRSLKEVLFLHLKAI